jgi:hypothetical protein
MTQGGSAWALRPVRCSVWAWLSRLPVPDSCRPPVWHGTATRIGPHEYTCPSGTGNVRERRDERVSLRVENPVTRKRTWRSRKLASLVKAAAASAVVVRIPQARSSGPLPLRQQDGCLCQIRRSTRRGVPAPCRSCPLKDGDDLHRRGGGPVLGDRANALRVLPCGPAHQSAISLSSR